MNDLWLIAMYVLGIVQGVIFGFVLWAPDSAFKQGFINGITLKFLWAKR